MAEDPSPNPFGPETLIKKSVDPAEIDAEIEAGLQETGRLVAPFVNNFGTVLPGGLIRQIVESRGELDVLRKPDEYLDWQKEFHSERFMSETPRQYFEAIDKAIEDSGIDRARLDELIAADKEAKGDGGVSREVLLRYALPVYRQLRLEGYSHYDLWV